MKPGWPGEPLVREARLARKCPSREAQAGQGASHSSWPPSHHAWVWLPLLVCLGHAASSP